MASQKKGSAHKKNVNKNNKRARVNTKSKNTTTSTNKKATVAKKPTAKKATPKNTNNNQPKTASKKESLNREVLAVGLIGLSLIILICVIASNKMGFVGAYASAFMRHTFGAGALVLPIVLLIFAIQMLREKEDMHIKYKSFIFLGFFLAAISLAHTLHQQAPASSFASFISNSYLNGDLKNGGLIGALIGGTLSAVIGDLGAYIVFFVVMVMLFIIATGKSIAGLLSGIGDVIDGVREDADRYYDEEDFEGEDYEEEYEEVEQPAPKKNRQMKIDEISEEDKAESQEDVKYEEEIEEEMEYRPRPARKRKGGLLSRFVKQPEPPVEEAPYIPPVETYEIGDDTSSAMENDLQLDNCSLVNQRHEYMSRPRVFDESIPKLQEKVKNAQEAISRGEGEQYVSKLLNDIDQELEKYAEKKKKAELEKAEALKEVEKIVEGEDDIEIEAEESNTTPAVPESKYSFTINDEVPQWDEAPIDIMGESAKEETAEAVSTPTYSETVNTPVYSQEKVAPSVLTTPDEINTVDIESEKIALDALKSINKMAGTETKLAQNVPIIPIVKNQPPTITEVIPMDEEVQEPTNEVAAVEEAIPQRVVEEAIPNIVPRTTIQTPQPLYQNGNGPKIIEAEKVNIVKELSNEGEIISTPYEFPRIDFLAQNPNGKNGTFVSKEELTRKAAKLEDTLNIFGVAATVANISQGPAVTRFELTPPAGVKVSKIEGLSDDIALALAATSVRIEAPIPGTSRVGIEIPNDEISNVYFREVLQTDKFNNYKSKLAFGMGKDITGNVIISDIADMPHLLIAGATGSGKSVCVNTIITSILYKSTPDEVKLILVDPKVVELSVYNGIPHLLVPVVTDPHKAAGALNWAVREMMRRYELFATTGTRKLEGYNKQVAPQDKLPQIVVIIDELSDLMMVAKKEVEDSIVRLTQLARAAGIHLIVATQRPSVNVITGLIKANIPSRIAFKVSSNVDSRTILDSAGAEKLLGRGDMLFRSVKMDKALRIQGAFVSDDEVEKIVNYIKVDESHYDMEVIKEIESSNSESESSAVSDVSGEDDLTKQAITFIVHRKKASISSLQRKFGIGYNRAANIMDDLEERGIVGADQGGTKGREVLMDKFQLQEWLERN